MIDIVASGRIADVILILMIVEGAALMALWRLRRIGVRPAELATNLLAGAMLVFALRSALTGGDASLTAAFLAGALLAHGLDLWARWR